MTPDEVAISKFLSYVLRHRPDEIGIRLDESGWVDVEALLERSAAAGRSISADELAAVVAHNDKQRFELLDGRIRASQGHSVAVDLALEPQVPPDVLFHGTVERFLAAILADGLLPQGRHDVHLSADAETATRVGQRRGRPVVLVVDAAGMHQAGAEFRRSTNGVWLTAQVEPRWITRRG